jgi:hypothetical protein
MQFHDSPSLLILFGIMGFVLLSPLLNPWLFRYEIERGQVVAYLFRMFRVVAIDIVSIEKIEVGRYPKLRASVVVQPEAPLGINFFSPRVHLIMKNSFWSAYCLSPPNPEAFAARVRACKLELGAKGRL